ncbi:DUF2273 domain-containing protein [Aerococcus suis]|uniref:Small integral membrane protein n=1 Tax=Aerococcus suis TaxID=371602 RepID=A0A1W1YWT9_9LACT|nr:DUF2273 domain-containing protein [Aerococcus suis]MCI7239927.1 DUF2273 domain-containing protein [Aerococcus suis]MDD7758023.1 DUF2273 domain-containing protein [Aerococcus suis]MDY4646465.1 DUF2273 domain-containing protein [Aerococcus suis]SMC40639.1 Small integral membrane protein [Aerococcus suis]
MDKQPKIDWKKYRGRVLGLVIAFLFALLWVTIGFGETLLVMVIVGVGYLIGAYFDGRLDVNAWLKYFFK